MIRKIIIVVLTLGTGGGCGVKCVLPSERDTCFYCDLCSGICVDGCIEDADCDMGLNPCEGVHTCEDCLCVWREPTCSECLGQPVCEPTNE